MNFDIGGLASLTDFMKGSVYYHDYDELNCSLINLFDILNGIVEGKEENILHFDDNSTVAINRYKKYLELIG